jgi:branched-subunit amino acid transport protein
MCVPAGALAGVGLIEFNWGGPPYDGGFAGYLVLFGAFLSLGQAPFVFAFARHVLARASVPSGRYGLAPLLAAAVGWAVAGLLGWTFGSALSILVPVSMASTTDLSSAYFVSRTIPWLGMGLLQALVLSAVLSPALRAGAASRRARVPGVLAVCAVWAVTSAVGGLLVEGVVAWQTVRSFVGDRRSIAEALSGSLQGVGVAENVAGAVIPSSLVVPALYGPPTGLALLAVRRRWATLSGGSGGAPGGPPGR